MGETHEVTRGGFGESKLDAVVDGIFDRLETLDRRRHERRELATTPVESIIATTRVVKAAGSLGVQFIKLIPHSREVFQMLAEMGSE